MRRLATVLLCLALTACGGSSSSESEATPSPSVPTSTGPTATVQGTPTPSSRHYFEVDGHRIWADCVPGRSPYAIYLHGLNGSAAASYFLATAVHRRLPDQGYCIYDRLNRGRSDQDPSPRDLADVVRELDGLMHAAHVPPPYVLVGHSFGGAVATAYAGLHPDRVAGIALSDAVLPMDDALLTPRVKATIRAASEPNFEHIDLVQALADDARMGAHLPDVPFVYVDALRTDLLTLWGAQGYREALRSYLASLPQGRLVLSNTTHTTVSASPQMVNAVVGILTELEYSGD